MHTPSLRTATLVSAALFGATASAQSAFRKGPAPTSTSIQAAAPFAVKRFADLDSRYSPFLTGDTRFSTFESNGPF